ncbi:MAG: sugar phosphate isomerase/epimerase family protein [Pirellulales bacterium]
MSKWPIGVFASVDAGLGVKLEVARELGVPTVQLHAPHAGSRTPEKAEAFLAKLKEYGLTLTVVFGGFDGESYADIPTVVRTVGLVPPETRAARLQEMKEISDFAKLLGCKAVGLHVGFVPHDVNAAAFKEIVAVTQDLCDYAKKNAQAVHLETGQETADGLLAFIHAVGRDNLFVNFDPANMILYGSGEPIAALQQVGKYVRSVHCKDGTWAKRPGQEWGCEVPLGQGDVGMYNYLKTLKDIGYEGPLTIEREIPQEPERQKAEIGHAVRLLSELKEKLL